MCDPGKVTTCRLGTTDLDEFAWANSWKVHAWPFLKVTGQGARDMTSGRSRGGWGVCYHLNIGDTLIRRWPNLLHSWLFLSIWQNTWVQQPKGDKKISCVAHSFWASNPQPRAQSIIMVGVAGAEWLHLTVGKKERNGWERAREGNMQGPTSGI